MGSHNHLGTTFKVWNGRPAWIWFVPNHFHDGGIIGAAVTEAEAISEACRSIEGRPPEATSRLASRPCQAAVRHWKYSLTRLECYLSRARNRIRSIQPTP
jgi:hypothetical protein